MKLFLLVIANICSVLATLTAITFCLAGRANATPEAISVLKKVTWGFLIVGVLGVVASIMLHRDGQKNATLVAFLPTLVVIVAFILAYVNEW